ncbi:Methenyltetrahydromethanopterin cyclohydrolase [Thauera humireducens]|uniref:methenyltetrahydromethanopterin cyclohydrolase n=1 Tax=Thauera humireducens TaxID=1134435 RepID=UPI002467A8FC|nr:methenyltetrahydromethanopterin cyclohydrolase [Thauera humireducens]CAH1748838.1 Methenyltetrahydromethanopterin cyclohydrolase [Thauera humireducens]
MSEHAPVLADSPFSINTLAAAQLDDLLARADAFGLAIERLDSGVTLIDGGIDVRGSAAAGVAIGAICMGGLGEVRLSVRPEADWPTWIEVASAQPVLACLGSQYAGWSLSASKEEAGGRKFFSLGSGPARALACREDLFAELGYRDRADRGVLVLEVDRRPPQVVIDKILRDCGLPPEALTLILTPTTSLAGSTQVVARVLEVAMHKAHELGFALGDIVEGSACAPLPAPSPDGGIAMGRTNDAILYGGRVQLAVSGSDEAAQRLAKALPSSNSRDYGRSFADIFRDYEYDFYKIDPALFAPAEVWVSNLDSGRSWHAGAIDMALLRSLWLEVDA